MSFVTDDSRDSQEVPLYKVYSDDPDPFYRYTIGKLVIRTRNSGKMKRTHFENLDVIGEKLNVPSIILVPFFGYGLSVASISAKSGISPSISGCFTVSEINAVFKQFIRNVVLCEKCLLPETDICVRKRRKEIYLRCHVN